MSGAREGGAGRDVHRAGRHARHAGIGALLVAAALAVAAPLTSQGSAAAAPPDGRYWAYVAAESADLLHRLRFDAEGLAVERTIPVGSKPTETEGPHGLAVSPDGRHLHLTTGHGVPDGRYWRYELGADTLAGSGTVLGRFPATIDVTPDGLYAFVANFNLHGEEVPSSVSVVYTPSQTEVARVETCVTPHGSRIDPSGRFHYSACMKDDRLVEIDTRTFELTRRLDVGDEEGVGDRAEGEAPACSPTWAEPSVDGASVFVACNAADVVLEIDREAWTVRRRLATGPGPYNLDVTPDGRLLLATLKGAAALEVFDLASGRSLARLPTSAPVTHGVTTTPDARYAFVSSEGVGGEPGRVDVFDLRALARAGSAAVGLQAGGIAFWRMRKGASSDAPDDSIDVNLRPRADAEGDVTHLDVELRVTALPVDDDGGRGFRMPVDVYSHRNIADRVENVRAEDRNGELEVTPQDEEGIRHWRLEGSPTPPVTIRYRSRVPPRRLVPGPPIDLRTFADGVSGGGRGFLVLPSDSTGWHVRLRWDLDELPAGSSAVTSLGEGDVATEASLGDLLRSFLLAGPLGRYPESGTVDGFSGFWLGRKDSVDMRAEMAWAGDAYSKLGTFFGDTASTEYRVLTRVLPEPETSGGTSSVSSFMMQVPKPTDDEDGSATLPRGMIVHEMIHGWVGGISGPGNTQWFSEGVTTYMTARTGLVLGLEPVEDYAESVSGLAADYYPNPFRNVSADSAAEAFWIHKTGERLPYARGALYFFHLNHRIRQASDGARSLDDVLLEFFEARDRGEPATTEAWLDRVEAELGPEAVATFDSIVVEGTKTIPLPPDALGPCFERRTVEARVPPFLYDRREGNRRLVAHVSEGTPPARAGLRTGDVVLTDFDPEEPPEPGETVTLEVERGESTLEITYEADPVRVESYAWDRVPDVSEDVCREGP